MQINSSLYGSLKQCALKHYNNPCLFYKGKSINYDCFLRMVDSFANGLITLNIKRGDVVTICAPNVVESITAFYAINKIGAINHMVHPLMQEETLVKNMNEVHSKCLIILNTSIKTYSNILNNSNFPVIIIDPARILGKIPSTIFKRQNKIPSIKEYKNCFDFHKLLHKKEQDFVVNNVYDDCAVLLNSGGSSGEPKIIQLSSYAMNNLVAEGNYILNVSEKEVKGLYMLAVLPMFHGFGLCMGVHAMLMHGGAINVMPKFHPLEVIKYIKKRKVNYIIGVPALFEALLAKEKFNGKLLRHLRICFIGGDFVSPNLIARFNKRMEENNSDCRLFEGYGLTETVTVCTVNNFQNNKDGSVGKGLSCVDIQIVDEHNKIVSPNTIGEIVVGGKTLMNGYLNEINPFIKINNQRYVKTGDLGYLDNEGFLFFKQRIKRLLKVKGINVFPSEIEKMITNYIEVKDACLVSVKSDTLRLYIVLNKGFKDNLDERIKEDIKRHISTFAVPKEIIYLKYMPQTNVAKTDYKVLSRYDYKQ
ncbi:MAG: class I adenylate-forming enzyme family protein [Bacilli bacterium]|nr:class I adenylate-forming enzyme family protein [Bacilli bacterium]